MKSTNNLIKGMALCCLPLCLASCNEDKDALVSEKTHVTFSIDEFETVVPSRTTTDPNNNYAITWASGDVIGIFPYEGYQEPFAIPTDQVGKTYATFDGGYWALKTGLTYNAYYPFDKTNFDSADMKTKIPVDYTGQKQEGTECGIGAYDYTYSDWTTATGGAINFSFHHIGAITVISLEFPATTATYTELALSADASVIPVKGTYDLTASTVGFTATEYASSLSMALNNCSVTAGATGVFYLMLPPMDLSSNEVVAILTSSTGSTYRYSLDISTIQKGKKYELTGKLMDIEAGGSTDGWEDDEDAKVITISEAGTLSTLISSSEKYTITKMKLSGELNSDDIAFIRDMAGCSNTGIETDGQLTSLDLSECSIVSGGSGYYTYSDYMYYDVDWKTVTTTDNEIPYCIFSKTTLTSVLLPNSVTSVSTFAFAGSNLTSVTLPVKVTSLNMNGNPFGYSKIENIYVPADHPTMQSIDGVLYDKSGETLLAFPGAKNDVSFPSTMTAVGDKAFSWALGLKEIVWSEGIEIPYGCFRNAYNLTSFEVPVGVTKIEGDTFYRCTSLSSVSLPEGVTSINSGNFAYSSLTTVTLPSTLKTISSDAFCNISTLKEVHCKATTPPSGLNGNTFNNTRENCTLYVPVGCSSAYAAADVWKEFSSIVEEE